MENILSSINIIYERKKYLMDMIKNKKHLVMGAGQSAIPEWNIIQEWDKFFGDDEWTALDEICMDPWSSVKSKCIIGNFNDEKTWTDVSKDGPYDTIRFDISTCKFWNPSGDNFKRIMDSLKPDGVFYLNDEGCGTGGGIKYIKSDEEYTKIMNSYYWRTSDSPFMAMNVKIEFKDTAIPILDHEKEIEGNIKGIEDWTDYTAKYIKNGQPITPSNNPEGKIVDYYEIRHKVK